MSHSAAVHEYKLTPIASIESTYWMRKPDLVRYELPAPFKRIPRPPYLPDLLEQVESLLNLEDVEAYRLHIRAVAREELWKETPAEVLEVGLQGCWSGLVKHWGLADKLCLEMRITKRLHPSPDFELIHLVCQLECYATRPAPQPSGGAQAPSGGRV